MSPSNPRRRRPPTSPRPPLAGELEDFEARPFGGEGGELLSPSADPPFPKVAPFVIEPPDWTQEAAAAPDEPPDDRTALEAMMDRERELGVIDEPGAPLGPTVMHRPSAGADIPPPDWRAEEATARQALDGRCPTCGREL